MFDVGDIVARHSHKQDLFFRIVQIRAGGGERTALLKGINTRLLADAPLNDLVEKNSSEIAHYQLKDFQEIYNKLKVVVNQRKVFQEKDEAEEFFEIPGRVLHLDGDEDYLNQCLKTYRQLGLEAKGICVSETEQPKLIYRILQENPTDILVLTGHDGFIHGKKDFRSLDSYRSSRYFVQSVIEARRFQPNRDALVIFAGACQSNYETILTAGANFASSPKRVLIHAFDPVFIVERIAYTPTDTLVSLKEVIKHTVTGTDGVGGIETRGQLRRGYPRSPY
ncbi:sporulation peptidase YabG [Desulfitobacterium sp.]|uniref:sporulation peptidase YabG n=1 Tax=Desulfitobacterium sp. TaxID=49981 RepID=UPI002B20F965|nr:sporulation peptidase YabG [Desulfitobacterium sp.]MEA4900212.1 sporulation peptidase YabG [Desulfitobacterium sp.]